MLYTRVVMRIFGRWLGRGSRSRVWCEFLLQQGSSRLWYVVPFRKVIIP